MKNWKCLSALKDECKSLENLELSTLLDIKFKVTILMMCNRTEEISGLRDIENMRKFSTKVIEFQKAVTELENTSEEAKDRINELKDR